MSRQTNNLELELELELHKKQLGTKTKTRTTQTDDKRTGHIWLKGKGLYYSIVLMLPLSHFEVFPLYLF